MGKSKLPSIKQFVLVVTVLLLISCSLLSVSADQGMIFISYPGLEPVIYEPGQKAIIAWNGQEEILILSTDVRASEGSLALRLLPLPSNPKAVERANLTSLVKLQQFIKQPVWYYADSNNLDSYLEGSFEKIVEVTFHEKIGAHNITVVRAEDASELAVWVNDFLNNSSIASELSLQEYESLFEDYISRGFPYFVLDIVKLSPDMKSVEPILYRFETDFLYYPLKISTIISGDTQIKLFILTNKILDLLYYYRQVGTAFPWAMSLVYVDKNETKAYAPADFIWSLSRVTYVNISSSELGEADLRLKNFFTSSALLTVLSYDGALDIFTGDLILNDGEALVVYPFMPSVPFGSVIISSIDYIPASIPQGITNLRIIPSNLISVKTLEEMNFQTPSQDLLVLVDYHSPAISAVSYSIALDGSVSIRCKVDDYMSGVDEVKVFYQAEGEVWKNDKMIENSGKFVAKIPVESGKNLNFYFTASDIAGNSAIEDNNQTYYLLDHATYTLTLVIINVGFMSAAIMVACVIAYMAKSLVEKRAKQDVQD